MEVSADEAGEKIEVPVIKVENTSGSWGNLFTRNRFVFAVLYDGNVVYAAPSNSGTVINGIDYGNPARIAYNAVTQHSRYLMAKDEHTVMRSSVFASMGVVSVTMLLYFSAAFVYKINPNLENASTCLIWAAKNVMPTFVGVVMITGILSAGISSASTFLSLIGTSLTNDILNKNNQDNSGKSLKSSRIVMGIVSIIVLIIGYLNPPQIFVIMYFGGTVIASAWGIVALASVWKKNMSESAAFLGMLFGFLGCVISKSASALSGITLPIYLDPFFIGLACSVIGMIVGNKMKKASAEDIKRCEQLHIRPDSEVSVVEDRKTQRLMWLYMSFGILLGLVFVFAYAIPYMNALK